MLKVPRIRDVLQRFRHPQPLDDRQRRWSEDRARFLQLTFDFLRSRAQGDYYEFGSHTATTIRQALTEAHRHDMDHMEFYAFDSFEGFPEEAEPDIRPGRGSRRGRMATGEEEFLSLVRKHGLYLDRIHTVKGFYSETLTHELQAELLKKSRIAFAFVDCVLYESARDVLRFIDPLLHKGSVLYLDDFYTFQGDPERGEQRALAEFQEYSSHRLNPHLSVS